jgi:hypothetical protein
VFDFFDREWAVIAKRTADLTRSPCGHHIEHVLPSDERFLVHPKSFRFDPFEPKTES